MGEKRKPDFEILLKKQGKNMGKIELFNSLKFKDGPSIGWRCRGKYRIRFKGVWFPKGERQFYTIYEVRDLLWRSLFL